MSVWGQAFETELRKLMNEEIQSSIEQLTGSTLLERDIYVRANGFLAGLRKALELLDDAESNLNKRT